MNAKLQDLYRERAAQKARLIELEAKPALAFAALAAVQEGKNDAERKALAAIKQSEGEAGKVAAEITVTRAALARIEGDIEAEEEVRRAGEWEIRRQMAEVLQARGYGTHDRDLTQAIEDVPLFEFSEEDNPF